MIMAIKAPIIKKPDCDHNSRTITVCRYCIIICSQMIDRNVKVLDNKTYIELGKGHFEHNTIIAYEK